MPSPTDYIIRFPSPADADAVLRLASELATSFAVREQSFRQAFGQLLSDRSACVRVAELGGVVIGYVLGFEHLTFYANGRVAWVEELMVAEAHRRQRVGKRLMDALTDWAAGQGCRMVGLATRRAADFYAALGYDASATYFRKVIGDSTGHQCGP
jgi:GNAT superfamily N-acetyltransferase